MLLNKIISVFIGIILFIPLSFADEIISESLEDNLPQTTADTNVHEDKMLGSLPQLPLEVEFENSSNEVAGDNELIVSLKVNYTETDIFPTIVQNTQGHCLIPLEDIEHFDVQEDYLKQGLVNYHDTAYINLDLLEGTKYDLNFENLDLNITFPAEKMQPQSFDASGGPMQNVDTKLISGAYLNYDITLSQNDDINYLAGVEELNYFTENGVYSYSFLFQTEAVKSNFSKVKNTARNQNKFTRLETNWTYENVDKMTNWRVGG